MDIVKGHWTTNDTHVRLSVPLQKVDKENRLVSGFATLDNVDSHKDVVLASASKSAFERFRGNIREMHQPIAVGVLKEFREQSFYDAEGNMYNGVFVTVYVSKGAQDTWEKVLDGTLSGFSIGGEIRDSEVQWVKDAEANIRFIKEYDLVELSLVDNPANQLSNVFSIQKSATGSVIKGMVAETSLVNVFWCGNDEIAQKAADESADCPSCGQTMTNIGWFEEGDNDAERVAETVDKFLRQKEAEAGTDIGEGGVNVAKNKNVQKDAASNETPDVVAAAEAEEAAREEAATEVEETEGVAADEVTEDSAEAQATAEEEAVEADEVASDEGDIEKMFDDLRDSIQKTIEKSNEDHAAKVEALEAQVTEFAKSFDAKTSEVLSKYEELSAQLGSMKEVSSEVEKRLEVIESSTAVKKSGDVQEPEKKLQKGLWGGTFFGE